ncbi:hydroxymethylbilane synthase [Mesonia hippocampi]|uniref:Hydroxymethylbilane synthase n=1 Tax=Mesonia hippocampi TaxID=1628250 RepID=A0A840ENJ7_9FLAO|nr:hydroxymethylbilane synthase [Mesonia hippocampi]MBB4118540.1 hydroxymethylbilane synthase [Mesonia hippocampi]
MSKTIRIGTRDSELALWQANYVKNQLENLGISATLVPVKSLGDLNLDQPLYRMGITGIFTKTLDVALLNKQIDLAVHSMKDVPTQLPEGIVEAAVFKRAKSDDILVFKNKADKLLQEKTTIATGSLRRKAQWLHQYPAHQVVDLRGNVNTRMKKLQDNPWKGAIFAAAGLERISLTPESFTVLDWMIPAPAQGAMLAVAREEDTFVKETLATLMHHSTRKCVQEEREFLRVLEGGCTAPIGALAEIKEDKFFFEGALFSLDGKIKLHEKAEFPLQEARGIGKQLAQKILARGGKELIQQIHQQLKD